MVLCFSRRMVALPSCGVVKTLLAFGLCFVAWAVGTAYGSEDVFTNSFVVEMNEGDSHNIHSIAKRHDFEYLGTVSIIGSNRRLNFT